MLAIPKLLSVPCNIFNLECISRSLYSSALGMFMKDGLEDTGALRPRVFGRPLGNQDAISSLQEGALAHNVSRSV